MKAAAFAPQHVGFSYAAFLTKRKPVFGGN
jgi:hypothetical protein